ncbi:MAG: hypothetical protein V4792_02395 [Pseudomonadota bacterium]
MDVSVDPLYGGSYIAVVVHDPSARDADQLAEYIIDETRPGHAIDTGIEIAHALIDGELH